MIFATPDDFSESLLLHAMRTGRFCAAMDDVVITVKRYLLTYASGKPFLQDFCTHSAIGVTFLVMVVESTTNTILRARFKNLGRSLCMRNKLIGAVTILTREDEDAQESLRP